MKTFFLEEFLFENPNSIRRPTIDADVQYEMIDENGNSVSIDGIDRIIQMSGVVPRQFQNADGTIVREYVVTDRQLVSQIQEKRFQSTNFENVQNVELHRPYKFVTSTGRQIEFEIEENSFDQFAPMVTEPLIDWSVLRQQDPDGQIDPEFIRNFINERHRAELQSIRK